MGIFSHDAPSGYGPYIDAGVTEYPRLRPVEHSIRRVGTLVLKEPIAVEEIPIGLDALIAASAAAQDQPHDSDNPPSYRVEPSGIIYVGKDVFYVPPDIQSDYTLF